MFILSTILSFLLLSSFAFAILQSTPPTLSLDNHNLDGVITALLRAPTRDGGVHIRGRQTDNACSPGHHQCSDGIGCCPAGQNCGVYSGKGGCCPEGQNCVSNSSPCAFAGYVLCYAENFCCPAGDICSRDGTGAQKCTKSSSFASTSQGVTTIPSALASPMTRMSAQMSSTAHAPSLTTSAPQAARASDGASTSQASRMISRKSFVTSILHLLAALVLSVVS